MQGTQLSYVFVLNSKRAQIQIVLILIALVTNHEITRYKIPEDHTNHIDIYF
jgi:hypothetical protein